MEGKCGKTIVVSAMAGDWQAAGVLDAMAQKGGLEWQELPAPRKPDAHSEEAFAKEMAEGGIELEQGGKEIRGSFILIKGDQIGTCLCSAPVDDKKTYIPYLPIPAGPPEEAAEEVLKYLLDVSELEEVV